MPPASLNPNVRGVAHSATLAINARSRRMAAAGRKVFRFGLGQSPFPVPEPVVESLRQHAAEKDYLPVAGLDALRAAVAAYHHRVDGLEIEPDGVLIGPGSKELLFLLQLAFDGDLLVPAPCWVSYAPQARILGRQVRVLQTRFDQRWRLLPDALASLCAGDTARPRLLILNDPGNPDGTTYTADELRALATIARQHRILVLSDEIYGPLDHRGAHVSIARFYPEGTIVSGGLSKWCGAGGWRLGTFAFPRQLSWLREAMAAVASETFTSVCAPVQYAAVTAFTGGPAIDSYLHDARRVLTALTRACVPLLREAGVRLHNPTGGFYMLLDFSAHAERLAARGITDGATRCERLLEETGVAALAGANFELPTGSLTARVAYVDFDGGAALSAAARVPASEPLPDGFAAERCGAVVEGFRALTEWVGLER